MQRILRSLTVTLALSLASGSAMSADDAGTASAPAKAPVQKTSHAAKAQVKTQGGKTQNANTVPVQNQSTPEGTASAPVAAAAGVATAGGSGSEAVGSAASTEALDPKHIQWPFEGMMGRVDKQSAERGFQIYKQVCSACHSMNLVAYRSLSSLGFKEAEIKALAAEKQVSDIGDDGQPMQRPALPSDHFVPPYPNEKASRAANGGAYPPDLSLIIKARHEGPDYVYSLLTGFSAAPAGETPVANKYYDPYFSGHWISMPTPLSDNVVSYQDGTPANVDQMARDVVNFLQWAAEPEMEARHEMGLRVLAYLIVLTGFLYAAKKRIWNKIGR